MHFPTKEHLAAAGTIVGIAGASFTALKSCVIYAAEQSLERKMRRVVGDVDISLKRLAEVEEGKESSLKLLEMPEYRLQLTEDLQSKLQVLHALRELRQRREKRRYEEPKGLRKWLLLYKPEGLDGWIVHSAAYVCLLIIGIVVVGIVRGVFQHDWDLLPTFFLDLFYVLPAIYLRNVSLRLRHVKAVLRNRSVEDPNAGLPFVKKALLLFPMPRTTVQKPNTNRTAKELLLFQSRIMESVRLAYYGCLTLLLLIGFAIYQWYRERLLSPSAILVVATVLVFFVGGLAESFRADVLARRADALLGASENEAADHAQGDLGQ